MEEQNNESKVYSKVPAKTSMWTSFKNFWLQPITLELTPYQKKIFKEVHDFWNQEIYVEKGVVHLRKPEDEVNKAGSIDESKDDPEVKVSL